jgi:cytochrome c1
MIFLLISIPLSLLCAYLAWLAFRVQHKRTALGLAIVSLLSTIFSIGVLGGAHYLMTGLNLL